MTLIWVSKGKKPVHGNPGGQVVGKQDDMTSESELALKRRKHIGFRSVGHVLERIT